MPDDRTFPNGMYLYGNTGGGKTTIIDRVINSLGRGYYIPESAKSLGIHPADWNKELKDFLKKVYRGVKKKQINFVVLDDMAIPNVTALKSLAPDYYNLLIEIKRCIEDAVLINDGERPYKSTLFQAKDHPLKDKKNIKGKIVWIFATNKEDVTGKKFEPIISILNRIEINFPSDPNVRKNMIKRKFEGANCNISDNLLERIVENTLNIIDGRKLLGDKKFQTSGIIDNIISKARYQAIENIPFKNIKQKLKKPLNITKDIVAQVIDNYDETNTVHIKNLPASRLTQNLQGPISKRKIEQVKNRLDKFETSLKIYESFHGSVDLKNIPECMTRYYKCKIKDLDLKEILISTEERKIMSLIKIHELKKARDKVYSISSKKKETRNEDDCKDYQESKEIQQLYGINRSDVSQWKNKNLQTIEVLKRDPDYKKFWPLLREHWEPMKN